MHLWQINELFHLETETMKSIQQKAPILLTSLTWFLRGSPSAWHCTNDYRERQSVRDEEQRD